MVHKSHKRKNQKSQRESPSQSSSQSSSQSPSQSSSQGSSQSPSLASSTATRRISEGIAGWRDFYRQVNREATGQVGLFEWGVVLTAALGLIVMQFGGQPRVFLAFINTFKLNIETYWELANLYFWVGACVLGYLVIPIIYLKACGESLSEYYLGLQGLMRHIGIYLALLVPTSLLVGWVSYWPDFQAIYPFYTQAGRSWFDLLAWEIAYGIQFFALEFFFRAFLLQSLRRSLGFGSILLMLLPYCMIHFPKTAAESAGSIVAGIILGMLAMRGRSIWGGVLIHWAIAIEMDVFSLAQKGALPPH